MKPEQQRIKIAEACGWTLCEYVESIGLAKGFPPLNNPPSYGTYENGIAELPDYPNDLNAMHEAEKVLDYNQLREMEDSVSFQFAVYPFHATASQRAEAFLRTIGKWTTPTQPEQTK